MRNAVLTAEMARFWNMVSADGEHITGIWERSRRRVQWQSPWSVVRGKAPEAFSTYMLYALGIFKLLSNI